MLGKSAKLPFGKLMKLEVVVFVPRAVHTAVFVSPITRYTDLKKLWNVKIAFCLNYPAIANERTDYT